MAKKCKNDHSRADAVEGIQETLKALELLRSKIAGSAHAWRKSGVLYCDGLTAKLRQVAFALRRLDELCEKPKVEQSSTTCDLLSHSEEVHFWLDSSWAFLYACMDIVAQVINQACSLGMDEKSVSFNAIASRTFDAKLLSLVTSAKSMDCVRSAQDYRNCALHRRHICIQFQQQSLTLSSGYGEFQTGAPETTFMATSICDDPLTVVPTFELNRGVVAHGAECAVRVATALKDMINRIKKVV